MWCRCPTGFMALWHQGATHTCSPGTSNSGQPPKGTFLEARIHLALSPQPPGSAGLMPMRLLWLSVLGCTVLAGLERGRCVCAGNTVSLGGFCLVTSGICLSLSVDWHGGCPPHSLGSVDCGTGDKGASSLLRQHSDV